MPLNEAILGYKMLLDNESSFRYFIKRRTSYLSEQEQLSYLPQSIKLEESSNPGIIRMTMLYTSLAVFIFLVWASMATISEVAKTKGEVVPRGFTQIVQHLDGGIVTEILVDEGDTVKAGQILVKIDDGGAQQDLAEIEAKQRYLQIEAERIRALLNDETPDFSPFIVEDKNNRQIIKEQKAFAYENSDLKDMNIRAGKLKENLRIAKEALDLQTILHAKGHASKLTLLRYQKDVSEIEARAHKEFSNLKSQIAQNKEILTKLHKRVSRLSIKAPVDGIIKGIQINTIGGIIEPGQTLMEIVPMDKKLVVETRILPRDIGHLRLGQEVRVKVSSYDFARYGAASGRVEFISATTFLDEQSKPYYRARINLEKQYVGNNSNHNMILPGMTVEADIVTGEKTILSYLLKPIHTSLQSAMTER